MRRSTSVPYVAHKGSNSTSAMYLAGKRCADILDLGQIPLVLLLTDHDPTGMHMQVDTRERLARYARRGVEVRRLALTMQQARRLPTNPIKETDPRTPWYRRTFKTDKCWELDALAPNVIADLIRTELDRTH